MKFLKYRHKFASHTSKVWDYRMLSLDDKVETEEVEEAVDGIKHEYSWSEHYRGLDYKVVDQPTPEWLEREMKYTRESMLYLRKKMESYLRLKEGMGK